MSFKTFMQDARDKRRVAQLKNEASQGAPARNTTITRMMGIPSVALAFMFTLIATVQPVAAVDINLSVITDVINAFIGIIAPLTNLIIAIVPLWFVMQMLAFIMGLMVAILAMIKFGKK